MSDKQWEALGHTVYRGQDRLYTNDQKAAELNKLTSLLKESLVHLEFDRDNWDLFEEGYEDMEDLIKRVKEVL